MDRAFRHRGIGTGERLKARPFAFRSILAGALLAALAGPVTPGSAADPVATQPADQAADAPKVEAPVTAEAPGPSFRAAVRAMVEQEVRKTGLPADIADAVVVAQ